MTLTSVLLRWLSNKLQSDDHVANVIHIARSAPEWGTLELGYPRQGTPIPGPFMGLGPPQ